MQALFQLTRDPNAEVRKRVCQALVILLEVKPEYLHPHLPDVVRFMLMATREPDEVVALEACEFWAALCETKGPAVAELRPFLPQLIPTLLSCMKYSAVDLNILGDEEDESVPDRAQVSLSLSISISLSLARSYLSVFLSV